MKIKLSPRRMDEDLKVSCSGDILTINGVEFDFSPLPDGATLPREAIDSDWFAGPVERIDGELHLTLRLPHGPNPSPAVAFPAPVTVTEDGPILLPFDPEPEPEPAPDVELPDDAASGYASDMPTDMGVFAA